MMKRLLVTFVVISTILGSNAWANPTGIGEIQEGNSWTQTGYYEDGWYGGVHYYFNRAVFQMQTAGDTFENPAISNMGSGWAIDYQNHLTFPTVVSVRKTGALVHDLPFWWKFQGVKSNPLTFVYTILRDDIALGASRCAWNGSKWTFTTVPPPPGVHLVGTTPAPGAILLGGIGVGLVGWLRRRRTL